jgi:hypothetical protein
MNLRDGRRLSSEVDSFVKSQVEELNDEKGNAFSPVFQAFLGILVIDGWRTRKDHESGQSGAVGIVTKSGRMALQRALIVNSVHYKYCDC